MVFLLHASADLVNDISMVYHQPYMRIDLLLYLIQYIWKHDLYEMSEYKTINFLWENKSWFTTTLNFW